MESTDPSSPVSPSENQAIPKKGIPEHQVQALKIDGAEESYKLEQDDHDDSVKADESAGVARVTAIAKILTTPKRVAFFLSVFIAGYAFGLDYLVRNTYLAYATASYQQHSLLSTVNVVRGVIVAALQPSLAKTADVFGRIEVFCFGVAVYTVGSIIEACANNVQTFAAGAFLYQLGYTTSLLMAEIMIADITAVKDRLFLAFVPNFPYLINTWISGNVAAATLSITTWRWGIGMFCIIYPVCAAPLILMMIFLGRQARKVTPKTQYPPILHSLQHLFWELDIIGVLLLTASLAMIMIPLTLAGGAGDKWDNAGILAPLIIGVLLMPTFIFWESKTSHPLLPFRFFKDRMVWACLSLGCFCTFAYATHASYLFTLLVVSYDFSVSNATRIASLYGFCAVLSAAILGLIVMKVRRLKAFVLCGVVASFIGVGLLIKFRGGPDAKAGVIAGEVFVGLAGGFFPYPSLILIQTVAKHQHMSILIGLMFTVNNLGVALGSCVSGAIWTQTLHKELEKNLAPFNNGTLASMIYAAPFYVVPEYPIGTLERDAIITSYKSVQRLLTITAACLTVPVFIAALFLRDPKLAIEQTQPEAEQEATKEDGADTTVGSGSWGSRLWQAFWS